MPWPPLPDGLSPYIAESIRERRRIKDLERETGMTAKQAADHALMVETLLKINPNQEFRNGIPYYPPPTPEEIETRNERRNQLRAMRVYRQSTKVRAKRYGIPADQLERITRQEIIDRDNSICYLCGKTCTHDEIHLDHVIPLSRGGTHTRKNLRVACSICNLDKAALTEAEYRNVLRLRYTPARQAGTG